MNCQAFSRFVFIVFARFCKSIFKLYGTVVEIKIVLFVKFHSFVSIEMEAVAEAVMDKRTIPLGNETNVDEVEMWNIKGTLKFGMEAVALIPPCKL